jgi:hypothetical protein
MIAQVIPSLKHGASEELMACSFLLVNKVLSWIYPDVKRSIKYPPEIGGYWWAIPALIKESGFAANELRLYTLSDESKKIIRTMSKTSKLWNFAKVEKESKEYEVHSRVDLQLVFSIYTHTDKNIQELIKRLNLEEKMEEQGFDNFYSNLKSYTSETKATRLKQGKTVENNTVTYLTRMYSPSFQRRMFKVKASKALIATLGYANRRFKNIFKEKYTSKSLITFQEWKQIILTESINYQDEDKTINLFEKIYQDDLIYHNRFMIPEDFKIHSYEVPECGKLFNMKYKEVKTSREGYYPDFGKAVILTCHDLMSDLSTEGDLMDQIRKTETYMFNQEVCEDDGFETAVRTWLLNFKKLGLGRDDLIEVYDFLVGVLSSTYALDILKRVDRDSHIFVDSFRNMWSSTQYLSFNVDKFTAVIQENVEISKTIDLNEIVSSKNARDVISESKDADRILAVNGWIKEINSLTTKDIKIKVGSTLELDERYLTEKYRDIEIKDLGEGYYSRDFSKDKNKNKLLLRELSLHSQGLPQEGHNLQFFRGIIHRKKTEKIKQYTKESIVNKYTVFSMEYDNKYQVQVVYENYREDLEKNLEMKAWLFFMNKTQRNGLITQGDMYNLGPLLETMNYFIVTSVQAKLEVTSNKFLFNPYWNLAGDGLKVYRWEQGFELEQNSALIPLNIHLGEFIPNEYFQQGEIQQNGILFRPLKTLIELEGKIITWVETERPIMANYLVTPWIKTESEINLSIVTSAEPEEILYQDTSSETNFQEPYEELRETVLLKYGHLFKGINISTDVMLNKISIIDSYIINIDTLAIIKETSFTQKEFSCNFTEKQFNQFLKRIMGIVDKAILLDHNDINAYNAYIEGVRLMNTYKDYLGELVIPSESQINNLIKEDKFTLKDHIQTVKIKVNEKSDNFFIAASLVSRGISEDFLLQGGNYYKVPTPKLHLLQPRVRLLSERNYLKFLYEPMLGEPENVGDQHKKTFQMLMSRGNLPINLLSDILTGTHSNDKSTLLLKMLSSKRGTAWCRTKMRISKFAFSLVYEMAKENDPIRKVLGLIEVLEF